MVWRGMESEERRVRRARVKLKRKAGGWPEAAIRAPDTRSCFVPLADHQACARGAYWLLMVVLCGGDVHALIYVEPMGFSNYW